MDIYQDIAKRTGGDIYIGVVGPVRTGKSTFIKRFMEKLVLPNIYDEFSRGRAIDELPQSGAGRTIMTTEPKFIPNEAVTVNFSDNAKMNVRMIDCVGYIVEGAIGDTEGGYDRMVQTPWSENEIPFSKAAEIGTRKVIREHSTIGIVMTTDGSVCDIPRSGYSDAENRVIEELKEINKPFIILVNSKNPESDNCIRLCDELYKKHGVCTMAVDCANMSAGDINGIIEKILFEFPLSEIAIDLPGWVMGLDDEHKIKKSLIGKIYESMSNVRKISDATDMVTQICEAEYAEKAVIENIDLGSGRVKLTVSAPGGLFYKILSDYTGIEIENESELMKIMGELAKAKQNYDRFSRALNDVSETGYGVVSPSIEDLSLEEPEIIKHGGRYGVRLRASAPSIHMIRYKLRFLKTA